MATIEKRGKGRAATYRVKIRRKGLGTETKTFDTYKDAERWAREIEGQMDRGGWVSQREAERTTLADALMRYASEITPSKKSARQELNRINQLKKNKIAQRALALIHGVDLAKFRDERLKEVSASTVRLDLALISHLYTVARQDWGMKGLANPVEDTRKPKAPKGRDRRLEAGEEKRLIEAAAADSLPWIKPLIELAIETAARQGEMLKALWRDADFQRMQITWRDTKNGTDRTVPLSDRALDILKALPRSVDGRVFPTTQSIVEKAFARVCAAAGIEDLHFHDLRHEGTSRLFELDLDTMEVQKITGHKTLQMLLRYTHLRPNSIGDKLRKRRAALAAAS